LHKLSSSIPVHQYQLTSQHSHMPVKSPSKPGAIPVPKVLNLLEACRSCCHASAAAICQSLSKSSQAQAALHFSTADASGWTPLLYAARNGWPDVVEQCLAGAQGSPHTARLQSSGNTGLSTTVLTAQPALGAQSAFNSSPLCVTSLAENSSWWKASTSCCSASRLSLIGLLVCTAPLPPPWLSVCTTVLHPADSTKKTQCPCPYVLSWYPQDHCVHFLPLLPSACHPLLIAPLQRYT
jgi:hypothetical protein